MSSPDRPVSLTGGAGFIGSHSADALLASGRRVRVIDALSTGRTGFTFCRARLEEQGVFQELAGGGGMICHLAAAVGVRLVPEEPVAGAPLPQP